MFGEEVNISGKNMLNYDHAYVVNAEGFMKQEGYDKVKKNTVEEVNYTDKSFEGGGMDGFKIETNIPVSKKVLDSDISYVKSNANKEKVEISSKTEKMEFTNTLTKTTTRYQEIIPFNQSNKNETTKNSAGSNLSKSAAEKIGDALIKIFKK